MSEVPLYVVRNISHRTPAGAELPLSSELGTNKTVKARFWP